MRTLNNLQLGILALGLAASATSQAQNGLMLTTVVDFNTPYEVGAQFLQESDGALYGGLTAGGTNGLGSIFKLTLSGSLTTLASFNGTNGTDPGMPILAPDGYFYGTTYQGGSNYGVTVANQGYGTIYRMDSNGVLTTLFSFNQTNGEEPTCFVLGNDGSFYGAAGGGTNFTSGFSNYGDGTIFKITTNGDFTLLVSFDGTNNGYGPISLIQASDGNFYGTTYGGGGTNGVGTVFRMTPDGQLTNLAVFNGTNGAIPNCLIQASDGCLYGITEEGGLSNPPVSFGDGVVFKVTTNGDFSVLAMFNGTNGSVPTALTEVSNGVFYCTTEIAGEGNGGGLFQVTTNGDLTQLLSFGASPALPGVPVGPLTKASDGNYYGYSQQPDPGAIYSIRPIQAPVLQASGQGNQLNLNWNAWAGYSYNVMYETNLTGSNWNLLSTVAPQTNGITSYSDLIGSDTQRFYRVVLQLP